MTTNRGNQDDEFASAISCEKDFSIAKPGYALNGLRTGQREKRAESAVDPGNGFHDHTPTVRTFSAVFCIDDKLQSGLVPKNETTG
jgi:hypothetical protein